MGKIRSKPTVGSQKTKFSLWRAVRSVGQPSFAGVLNLSKFIKGVEKYAKSQNINLKGFRSKKIPTFKNAVRPSQPYDIPYFSNFTGI